MQTVQLGKSAMHSSRLAYGCWRLAGNLECGKVSLEAAATGRKAVLTAHEAGFTLFDLADIYSDGACETIFGEAVQSVSGMRDRILVATKCGIRRKGSPLPSSPYRYDFSAAHIIESCEQSLVRMGLERIDLFMLHRPDYLCRPEEVAAAFSRLRQSGKVREFGVSNFRPSQLDLLQKACSMTLQVNQVEISLAHIEPFHDGTLDQCMTAGITPMAWSPLDAGRLADGNPIDLQAPDHAHRIHVREMLDIVARERGVTRSVAALAWLLRHPSGIIPIIGTTHPGRIQDAINAPEIELSRDDWYRLMEAAHGQRLP